MVAVMAPEVRAAALVKAKAARAANNAARKASTLRRDFADALVWEDMARERKLRLPPWGEACTVSKMRTWLHKISLSQRDYEVWAGCKLADFPKLNPDWPLRAFGGITLEYAAHRASEIGSSSIEKGL